MLHGQLFFASTTAFRDLFHTTHDPADVVIDFQHSRVWDHSGIEAIVDLARRHGVTLIEDVAQTTLGSYKGKRAGSIGDAGTFSFNSSKFPSRS